MDGWRPFPSPAGGMHPGRFADMAAEYGPETVLMVGGALLGDSGRHRRRNQEPPQPYESGVRPKTSILA